MSLDAAQLGLAGAAALGAGAVNALAGGGTLISFPALLALGVPALPANVTNTVSLCPGYLSGTVAQRDDLAPEMGRARWLAGAALVGGVAGSALLELTPGAAFKEVVPFLILASCLLLVVQEPVRDRVRAREKARAARPGTGRSGAVRAGAVRAGASRPSVLLMVAVLVAGGYGGYFGAGLGIMLLGLLGLFSDGGLVRLNALKQALSLVINVCAAVLFAATGHVQWQLVPVMAVAALVGGALGGRLTGVVNPKLLRGFVVLVGVAVAIRFWV